MSRASILRDLIKEDEEKNALIKEMASKMEIASISQEALNKLLDDGMKQSELIEELQHVNGSLRNQLMHSTIDVSLCFNCAHAKRHAEDKCHCNTCCYKCDCSWWGKVRDGQRP